MNDKLLKDEAAFWKRHHGIAVNCWADEQKRHAETRLELKTWRLATITLAVILAGMTIADVLNTKVSWM